MSVRLWQAVGLPAILITSYAAVATSPGDSNVSGWWLASGIAACLMIISPKRDAVWLLIAVAVLSGAGNLLGGRAPSTGPLLGLGNGLEAYVIARLLTRNWNRDVVVLRKWTHLQLYFVAIGLGSAIPAALSVVLSLTLVERDLVVVATWIFINHVSCNLVMLLFVTRRRMVVLPTRIEVATHMCLLLAAFCATYAPDNKQPAAFLLMPMAVWAGARFPPRWAAVELLVIGGIVTVFAGLDIGPFRPLTPEATFLTVIAGLQSFMGFSVLIALVFATALALERERGVALLAQQQEVEQATAGALQREQEANARMLAADRDKTELISTISHELRTPLTSIVGYVELLEEDRELADDLRADLLGRVSRNADRLLALAEDVLTIAAIDQRELVPDRRVIDLRGCAMAAQDAAVVPEGRRNEVTLVVDVPPDPVEAFADPQQIDRVVLNFVSNAIKFTVGVGTVTVRLEALEPALARLSVTDTGLGIPQHEQGQIFERFFRSSVARSEAIPGTGLGLSIVQSIAEAHDGSVGFSSEAGRGSTFWVELPLVASGEGDSPDR